MSFKVGDRIQIRDTKNVLAPEWVGRKGTLVAFDGPYDFGVVIDGLEGQDPLPLYVSELVHLFNDEPVAEWEWELLQLSGEVRAHDEEFKEFYDLISTNFPEEPDMIDHPAHYNFSDIEPIDAIEAWGLGYHLGTVIKYVARHEHKGKPLEDLKKARWFLDRKIAQMEMETVNA